MIQSAFTSAGQRCSALRVLYLQEDIADTVIEMLRDAMRSLVIGNPALLSTDIGPVIDRDALSALNQHIEHLERIGRFVAKAERPNSEDGHWIAPHIFEIDRLEQLNEEVFGPILHIIRYAAGEIDQVIDSINGTGYGLTLGVHSRISDFADYVYSATHAGNTYVNRNMIGAVVGVNPFGGTGLSGTGPKAGGPHYLYRFSRCTREVTGSARPTTPDLAPASASENATTAIEQLQRSVASDGFKTHSLRLDALSKFRTLLDPNHSNSLKRILNITEEWLGSGMVMPGPTGEQNLLQRQARGISAYVVAADQSPERVVAHIICLLATGSPVLLLGGKAAEKVLTEWQAKAVQANLPVQVRDAVSVCSTPEVLESEEIKAVAIDAATLLSDTLKQTLAMRNGALTPVVQLASTQSSEQELRLMLTGLITERTFTDNLVAKGGDTQLYRLAEG